MTDNKKYIIDTNSLINNPYVMEDYQVVITSLVLRELETLERRKNDRSLQYSIRVAKRMTEKMLAEEKVEFRDIDNVGVLEGYDESYVDNKIVKYALSDDYGIVTDDILLKHKAMSMGIEVIASSDQEGEIEYKGFKEVYMNRDEIDEFYQNFDKNDLGILEGQYLVIKSSPITVADALVWTGDWFESIFRGNKKMRSIPDSEYFDRFESKDVYQAMAIDSLYRNQVTMIRGKAGSGKSLMALTHAWNKVEGNDARLVIFFNPAPSRDSITLGFNKGSLVEKAMQSSVGSMLKSKFGDEYQVEELILAGKIELMPFTDLRGWDSTSERETVTLISEAQNLTDSLLKLGLQRIDDSTQVIIDGDYNQQVDRDAYLHSNGMKRASEVLRGTHLYGEVELQNTYRSELAGLVEEM